MMNNHNLENPNIDKLVLNVLEKCRSINHLKQVQSFLTTLGHAQTQFLAFKLVRFAILSLSNLDYARSIFDTLHAPNVYLYTAMITAYAAQSNRTESALVLYKNMVCRASPKPNHYIYPHVLKCCSESWGCYGAKLVHTHVLKWGFGGYPVVQTALVDSYLKGNCGSDGVVVARRVFDEMSERNVVSWTAMVSGYARNGRLGDAVLMFEEMPERDVPAWNAVIAGCTQNGLFLEAISYFRRMLLGCEEVGGVKKLRPNQVTVVCVLSACGNLGMLKFGRWVHGYVYRSKIDLNSFILNALVDMYGKCGSLEEARRVFDQVSEKSLTVWNSMINCLALHGLSERAIHVYEEMTEYGGDIVKPDGITFVGLLNACTHGGLVDAGCMYFNLMTRKYGIEQEIQHYGCYIDLLGRAGRFEEAMEVIKCMRVEPDEVIWGSLLNGCKIHRRMDLAEYAVKRLVDMDPNNAGYGIMLANVYGEIGDWDEVRKVRKMLKERGVKKTPGCSWIEIDKEVRQFYSADKTHFEIEEIYKTLDSLVASF
ncbi:hypothetical protein Scep_003384 [Stephania cephalantha]|uniref:Pentatricopeptide repeat-containing protein n=1 Tax=Stephania cephalantha TaxID=152367 RepID=A0AAP0KSZ5_9MAGN